MNKNRPKILFYVPLPPPVHGAALRNKSLVESKVLNSAFEIIVIPFNFADSVHDIGRLSIWKLTKMIGRLYTVIHTMLRFGPQLVYFNFSTYGYALYRDFLFALIFKSFRTNVVFHLRTQGVKSQSTSSNFKRGLFKTAFKNATVICLSDYLAKDVEDVYRPHPVVVNNGIEDVFPNYTLSLGRSIPVVLFLSNLSRTKGILDLIGALEILKSESIPFEALIVGGEGDLLMKDINAELEIKSLTSCVRLLGPLFGEEKFKLYCSTDIFVFPTCFEAFPGVVLEAMQFCLPVVSTFEGAIPEIVEDGVTGLLVQKQNVNDLAEKLKILLNDEALRKALGNNGRSKFVEKYRLHDFENKMVKAFNDILEN